MVEEKDIVVYDRILEEIKPYLKSESKLLDIGCGTSVLHYQLSMLVGHIEGIDYSENMIQIAKEKAKSKNLSNVTYSCGTLVQSSVMENSYDIVTAFYILHLFEDFERELALIKDSLGEQGFFISVTPCMKNSGVIDALLWISGAVGIIPKIKRYTYQDLTQLIEKSGFEIIEVKAMRDKTHEYMIVAQKI